jgi:hypothetical protein
MRRAGRVRTCSAILTVLPKREREPSTTHQERGCYVRSSRLIGAPGKNYIADEPVGYGAGGCSHIRCVLKVPSQTQVTRRVAKLVHAVHALLFLIPCCLALPLCPPAWAPVKRKCRRTEKRTTHGSWRTGNYLQQDCMLFHTSFHCRLCWFVHDKLLIWRNLWAYVEPYHSEFGELSVLWAISVDLARRTASPGAAIGQWVSRGHALEAACAIRVMARLWSNQGSSGVTGALFQSQFLQTLQATCALHPRGGAMSCWERA